MKQVKNLYVSTSPICDVKTVSILMFIFSLASSNMEKEQNVDSGVSADKSESTSSDNRAAGPSEGPANIFVNAGPSSSNVRTILLKLSRPKRERNYRKRKTPDRDTDSNDSSRDSDDLFPEETMPGPRQIENSSEPESDDVQRLMGTFSEGSPSGYVLFISFGSFTLY